jgi:putative nucleotidyltransferase with HDIG domain
MYRIKQFIWALKSEINYEDEIFINKYLNNKELELFFKLSIMDQKHCVNTAKDIKKVCEARNYNLDKDRMVKIALLHDIGKIQYKMNIIEKSLIVILNKLTKGKIKKYRKVKCINIYYNHPNIGYNLLKKYNYEESFINTIKNHHNNDIIKDILELEVLRECDNNN